MTPGSRTLTRSSRTAEVDASGKEYGLTNSGCTELCLHKRGHERVYALQPLSLDFQDDRKTAKQRRWGKRYD